MAGAHRLEACKRLGWHEIECSVAEIDGLKAELAEIDENIVRHDVDPIDLDDLLLRRKEIYEAIHPETKAGTAGGKASGEARRTTEPSSAVHQKSFVDDTAEKMGVTPRNVRSRIQIAKDLTPEVKHIVKESKIGAHESLKLSRIKEPEKQKEVEKNIFEKGIDLRKTKVYIYVRQK